VIFPAAKISLAVSSTEFCQAMFDEGDIREGLSKWSYGDDTITLDNFSSSAFVFRPT
jgi:hypothetical protein